MGDLRDSLPALSPRAHRGAYRAVAGRPRGCPAETRRRRGGSCAPSGIPSGRRPRRVCGSRPRPGSYHLDCRLRPPLPHRAACAGAAAGADARPREGCRTGPTRCPAADGSGWPRRSRNSPASQRLRRRQPRDCPGRPSCRRGHCGPAAQPTRASPSTAGGENPTRRRGRPSPAHRPPSLPVPAPAPPHPPRPASASQTISARTRPLLEPVVLEAQSAAGCCHVTRPLCPSPDTAGMGGVRSGANGRSNESCGPRGSSSRRVVDVFCVLPGTGSSFVIGHNCLKFVYSVSPSAAQSKHYVPGRYTVGVPSSLFSHILQSADRKCPEAKADFSPRQSGGTWSNWEAWKGFP